MILTGRAITASEAFDCGIINKLCKDMTDLHGETLKTARTISKHSIEAIMAAKQAVSNVDNFSLETALEIERNLFSNVYQQKGVKSNLLEAFKMLYTWHDYHHK